MKYNITIILMSEFMNKTKITDKERGQLAIWLQQNNK